MENENQLKGSTYLAKRYTISLINRIENDEEFENGFINIVLNDIDNSEIENKDVFITALAALRQIET